MSEFKYIFGPVRSRRLGWSLGIDIISYKTCSFDCVYCECGRTTNHTIERKEYVSTADVISEISVFFEREAENCLIDVVTLSGSGEPTLHSKIDVIIKHIRKVSSLPVCLITNSSLFSQQEVINSILGCDIVVPSLDAVSQDIFSEINRPHFKIRVSEIIDGLINLRKKFSGRIFLEVFLAEGVNDSMAEISKLVEAIKKISPDKVQLNTLDRPPADNWVRAIAFEKMIEIQKYIEEKVLCPVEIIKRYQQREENTFVFKATPRSVQGRIIQIISRRPAILTEIAEYVSLPLDEVKFYLDRLVTSGKVEPYVVGEKTFFRLVNRNSG